MGAECPHCHRHRQISLAGTGRANSKCDSILANGLNIFLLAKGFGFERASLRSNADHILRKLGGPVLLPFADQRHDIVDVLFSERLAIVEQRKQGFDHTNGRTNLFRIAGHLDIGAAKQNRYPISLFNHFNVGVKAAEESQRMLHPFYIDQLLDHLHRLSRHGHRSPAALIWNMRASAIPSRLPQKRQASALLQKNCSAVIIPQFFSIVAQFRKISTSTAISFSTMRCSVRR